MSPGLFSDSAVDAASKSPVDNGYDLELHPQAHESSSPSSHVREDTDKFLNLLGGFDGMLEIGDEVTVPSSPLSFPADLDHCYFSAPRFDCISESGIPEFHDLFGDLSPYQPFGDLSSHRTGGGVSDVHDDVIEVQEQVIASHQCSTNGNGNVFVNSACEGVKVVSSEKQTWMQSRDVDVRESGTESFKKGVEDDSSSTSDSEQEEETTLNDKGIIVGPPNKRRRQNQNHHTGPFPHTLILSPAERRTRFCFGLQTIVTKIKALISGTGCSADFRAEFEGHSFSLENAEQLFKKLTACRYQTHTSRGRKCIKEENKDLPSSTISSNFQGPDDDHRYAATILTQSSESSSICDHQYNDVSTTTTSGQQKQRVREKCFIRTKYDREKKLRKGATTIYSKMQRLINRTGANMTLVLKYQGLLVTPKNYAELEHLFGRSYKPTMKRFNTEIIVEKRHNPPESQLRRLPSSNDVCDSEAGSKIMKISFQPGKRGHNVELLGKAFNNAKNLSIMLDSDFDDDSTDGSPEMAEEQNSETPVDELSTSTNGVIGEIQLPNPFSFPVTEQYDHLELIAAASSSKFEESQQNIVDNYQTTAPPITADVCTNTEPVCEICVNSNSLSLQSPSMPGEEKFPCWIRCANPLCHYLVHPECIGFAVTNAQLLRLLPPFFCPSHRGAS